MKEKIALIYGVLLEDGCLSKVGKASFISITCDIHSDLPFIKKIHPVLEELRGKPIKIHERPNYGKVEINFSDKNMFCLFKTLGFPVGKKGTNLSIPTHFTPFMKQIVQGYFATDGSLVLTNNNGVIYPRIEFTSISRKLLNQVNNFLLNLDIKGEIYLSKKYTNGYNDLYRLQVNGRSNLETFRDKIGFVNQKHKTKLYEYEKYGSTEI